jgi:hypothetical protein
MHSHIVTYKYILQLRTKLHIPNYNSALVNATTSTEKYIFCVGIMMMCYVLQIQH